MMTGRPIYVGHASKFGRDYAFGKLCLFREYFGCDWKPIGDLCSPIESSRNILL